MIKEFLSFLDFSKDSIKSWAVVIGAWTLNIITQVVEMSMEDWTQIAILIKQIFAAFSFLAASIFTLIQAWKFMKKKEKK